MDMAGEAISKTSLPHYHPHDDANPPPPKKKRNLPGTPDPEAEVIALSPKSLLATNRFPCEICGKGFQRDQNLQLHRRGHNLPWKLRQRSSKEPRKRVYVCPEKSCVHHNPSRALGDLTGIKKHFCRKHGEKKWKCEKCSKRYAVQSDWKAHAKTCGTREYRCDCGTLFSRRDSFITHRAFCDALAEESARISAASNISTLTTDQLSHPTPLLKSTPNLSLWMSSAPMHVFTDVMHSTSTNLMADPMPVQNMHYSLLRSAPSLYSSQHQTPRPIPDMSATAMLQKAAQIGVTSSTDPSLFVGFGGGSSRLLEVDSERYDGLMASLAPIPNCLVQSCFNSGLENSGSEFSTLEQLEMEGGKTRDFLGVRFQPLCPSSIQGWI